MIQVYVNREKLEYDIYALFKAFYPEEELNIEVVEDGKESTGVPSFYDVILSSSLVSCSYICGEVRLEKE